MKKFFYLIPVTCLMLSACKTQSDVTTSSNVPDPAHNSRISVDWAGVYKGVIPCADCPGIEDEIRLNEDLTYKRTMDYLERDSRFSEQGRFEWDDTGGRIRLIPDGSTGDVGNWYRVGENRLFMLDNQGNRIDNNIPSAMYTYHKIDLDDVIREKYWKLIELNGKAIAPTEEGFTEAHIVLKNNDNRVVGNTGCNNVMGTYTLSESPQGNKISFSQMASTRMACMGVNHEQEFLNVFEDTDGYSIRNDTLTLSKENVQLAKFTAVYLH